MFGEEQLFPSPHAVESVESELSSDSRKDEQDIRSFIRAYAERPAMRIVKRFTRNQGTYSPRGGGGGGGGGDPPADQSSPYEGGRGGDAASTARYCTQACLLGLCRDGSFDPACPNTPTHSGQGRWLRHPVSASEVCWRVRDRLTHNLDDGCECLDKYGMFGATGVLFRITDPTYGYTFVAKGVQEVDTHVLFEEASIYTHCLELQGTRIPVYLGIIKLVYHYPLCSTATVSDLMLLSWAGPTLASGTTTAMQTSQREIDAAVELLERHGIEHDDIREANLTWNDEVGGVMVIDFDRAFIHGPAKRQRTTEVACMAASG